MPLQREMSQICLFISTKDQKHLQLCKKHFSNAEPACRGFICFLLQPKGINWGGGQQTSCRSTGVLRASLKNKNLQDVWWTVPYEKGERNTFSCNVSAPNSLLSTTCSCRDCSHIGKRGISAGLCCHSKGLTSPHHAAIPIRIRPPTAVFQEKADVSGC